MRNAGCQQTCLTASQQFIRISKCDKFIATVAHIKTSGENFTYEPGGNITSYTDEKNQTITRQYDKLNRLIAEIRPAETAEATPKRTDIAYNSNTITITNAGEKHTFTKDALGRITSILAQDANSQKISETTYAYSAEKITVTETKGSEGTTTTIDAHKDPINWTDVAGKLGKGILQGAIKGDYYESSDTVQGVGKFVGQVGMGFIPVLGQLADVRDLTAAWYTGITQGWNFTTGAGLAMAGVALIPGIGDAAKAGVKGLFGAPLLPVANIANEGKYIYSAIKPGPLNDSIAGTFAGGRYSEGIIQPNQLLFRGGDAANPGGSFFTFEPPAGIAQTRIDNAVRTQWINPITGRLEGRSPINSSISVAFPPGTKYYYGPVSSQGAVYVGGWEKIQIYVPNARNIGKFTPLHPLQ